MSTDRKRTVADLSNHENIDEDPQTEYSNFAIDDQKIERPQELEANFKRRKIEEWKQRMGFTPHGTGVSNPLSGNTGTGNVGGSLQPSGSAPVIDLQAIKKQVEERKKLALETLKKSKSIANNNGNQETPPLLASTTSPSVPVIPKAKEPIFPRVSQPAAKLELVKPSISKDNAYFDPSLGIPTRQKRRGTFKFVSQGKFIQKGQKLRAEAKLEALKQQVSESLKKSKVGAQLTSITDKTGKRDPPPLIEWWDLPFALNQLTYEALLQHWESQLSSNLRNAYSSPSNDAPSTSMTDTTEPRRPTSLITSMVFHPKLLPPVGQVPVVPRPVMLTKKERKKLRRQRRLEEQKEKQDKIRLGLLPPEQPKVRIANLMRVLQNEAIQDPTKVEAQVRHQMEQRKKKHEQTNQARQLTKEQKRDKKMLQIKTDASKGLHACIFKCHSQCTTSLNKAKIYQNVTQLGLTGIGVFFEEHHVVVVEGGEKSLRHFKKLMLRRIQWQAPADDAGGPQPSTRHPTWFDASVHGALVSDEEDLEDPTEAYRGHLKHLDVSASKSIGELSASEAHFSLTNTLCWLLWEGDIGQPAFNGFKFKQCHTEKQVLELFASAKVEHYWDLAKNWTIPASV